MDEILLEARDLRKYFPVRRGLWQTAALKAVDGVSFSIRRGEVLGLVGESGCGKTTVGRTLLGLYEPTAGQVFFRGRPTDTKAGLRALRQSASMVFQDPCSSLDPRMTVLDLIGEPLGLRGTDRRRRREQVLTWMDRVGLGPEYAGRYPHEFSGGQRQRIGIARALVTEPELVICDEPVSALDVSIQAQVLNLFADLRQQMELTCLFIAHDLPVVRHICDRIAVMYLGKIVEIADAGDLCDRPVHPYSRCLLSAVAVPDPELERSRQRTVLRGELPSPMEEHRGCPFRSRCPCAGERCALEAPRLRQIGERLVACHRAEELA